MHLPGGMSSEESDWESDYFTLPSSDKKNKFVAPPLKSPEEQLLEAVMESDIAKVQEFLLMGANVNYKPQNYWNAVIEASALGHFKILKLLLERGADVNSSHEKFSPILAVCGSSSRNEDELLNCLELLLSKGAQVNTYDWCRLSPLYYAVKFNHLKLVTKLIQEGANVNCIDNDGRTPIFSAVALGNLHLVSLLIDSGADIYVVDWKGCALIDIALEENHSDMLNILSGGVEINNLLYKIDKSDQYLNTYQHIVAAMPHKCDRLSGFRLDVFDIINAVKLPHLNRYFYDSKISFGHLLTADENKLRNIGINFCFERRKILRAVQKFHEYPWSISSLGNTETFQNLDLYRNAEFILTITKQLYLISLSSYLWVLQGGFENQSKLVVDTLQEYLKKLKLLRKKIKCLHTLIKKINQEYNTEPSDLILPIKCYSTPIQKHHKYLVCVAALCGIFLCYKKCKYDWFYIK